LEIPKGADARTGILAVRHRLSGPGINGAVMQRQNPQQPWMNYVDVASIDAAIDRATKLGAKVALPKTPIPGVGAVAAIVDPQGNVCGLWEQAQK
jgi:predicted enzyme related to lactoylglutathione lyase